jgi:3-methyladenine DNA glycosylase AlkC
VTVADVKDEYSLELVAALAGELHRAWPAFPATRFGAEAASGLGPLALLARLTPRFSSEGPVRPFIEAHPDITYAYLHRWAGDPDEHVRRLASEGTRPRLPWASHLRSLIADPTPAIALLDLLVDDPSGYVRRSVANHLNAIAKDHPDLALDCARRWLATGSDRAAWVVQHGLRTMVKRGDPAALVLLGFDHATPVRIDRLTITPARLAIGGEATIELTLAADRTVRIAVDYLVQHAGAHGPRAEGVQADHPHHRARAATDHHPAPPIPRGLRTPALPRHAPYRHPSQRPGPRRRRRGAGRRVVMVVGRTVRAVRIGQIYPATARPARPVK